MPLSASSSTRPEMVLGISFFFASPLSAPRKSCKAEIARRHTSPRAARRRAVTPQTGSATDKTEIPAQAAKRGPLGARASSGPVIFLFFLFLENIQLQGIRADYLEFSAAF